MGKFLPHSFGEDIWRFGAINLPEISYLGYASFFPQIAGKIFALFYFYIFFMQRVWTNFKFSWSVGQPYVSHTCIKLFLNKLALQLEPKFHFCKLLPPSDYSPCFWGGWGTEPNSNFYAWNRCLEVPGVSSWGCTAKAPPSPSARGLHLAQASFFQIKGPKWPLGPVWWHGWTFQT